jgi:hypothetical protein
MGRDLKELFKQTIPLRFDFLVTRYGFSLYQASQWHFVAQSPYCQITMEMDKKRFGCWLERKDVHIFPYHPIDVMVLATCLGYQHQEAPHFFSNEEEAFIRDVELYVTVLEDYCSEFLRGDFTKWEKIMRCLDEKGRQQEKERERIAQERRLNEAREAARTAWANKDYQQVIVMYESILPFLTPSEKKKLEYARRRTETV